MNLHYFIARISWPEVLNEKAILNFFAKFEKKKYLQSRPFSCNDLSF